MSIRLYRLLLWLLAPLIIGFTWWQGRRQQETGYLPGRLGGGPASRQGAVWLHAASVGEVHAALPLLNEIARAHPGLPLLLTTTTSSGARIARQRLPAGARHAFLPLDYPLAIRRFLQRHQPSCALIIETELWPNLYRACARRQIPLVIVNGRLSARTLRANRWLRGLYRDTLAQTQAVLARSEGDARGFVELGAPICEVIGNIKFAAAPLPGTVTPLPLGQPYVLAASTRDGEEALLLQAWRALRRRLERVPLLVIAPRHVQRRERICQALAGEQVAVRSRGEAIGPETTVYLADTFGELPALIAGAELVFVGGSLVPRGGQNLLEPAALGKATLFGPHMENFFDEALVLLEAGAARQVQDPAELAEALAQLLQDPAQCQRLGEQARLQVDARRDLAARYLRAIGRYCPALAPPVSAWPGSPRRFPGKLA